MSDARWPAALAGVGLGGFLDGIVLHQVLQWHHLVVEYRDADDLSGLEYNTFWDGVFHLVTWLVLLAAVVLLVRRADGVRRLGTGGVVGWMLVGWGAFNLADQVVFHLLLGAHHIRQVDNYQVYDWGFAALGALLVAAGLRLARRDRITR